MLPRGEDDPPTVAVSLVLEFGAGTIVVPLDLEEAGALSRALTEVAVADDGTTN